MNCRRPFHPYGLPFSLNPCRILRRRCAAVAVCASLLACGGDIGPTSDAAAGDDASAAADDAATDAGADVCFPAKQACGGDL